MPSACALRVISLAKSLSLPAIASATTTAASFAERVTMPLIASSTTSVLPGLRPSLVGACPAASLETLSEAAGQRSEEHTSELQSRPHLVCRLLLEKKNGLRSGPGA